MFRKVDCLRLQVPDVAAAEEFYRQRLGLALVWRRADAEVGLRFQESDTELVLTQGEGPPEVDLSVASTDEAVREFVRAGGSVVEPPFDIAIGRCAVVRDPWGNQLVLLDSSKGLLRTDADGDVVE